MQKIIIILGGARSGKSHYALAETSLIKGKKAFIATAEPLDDEMHIRIENHKKERGNDWDTYEEPIHIAPLISRIKGKYDVILIDCLTLWVSNIMHAGFDIVEEAGKLVSVISTYSPTPLYIISNEVGLGLVPESPLGRAYRDNLGHVNRQVAQAASDVIFMFAGIPLKIKSS
ncbi:MAG: bifunctional adenosylcobinamide kinase/adenosylcobinamide-phosphate guanylyltransferase [Proteobacteria bacterium]|nr:bifunctional adenosylcobinamide kinase/adenosylcobinamide-phosphate guanylyltransferase [Pseudomonadota bacterium]